MQYPNQLTVVIFCNYYTGQLFGIVIYGIWLSPLTHSLTYLTIIIPAFLNTCICAFSLGLLGYMQLDSVVFLEAMFLNREILWI